MITIIISTNSKVHLISQNAVNLSVSLLKRDNLGQFDDSHPVTIDLVFLVWDIWLKTLF